MRNQIIPNETQWFLNEHGFLLLSHDTWEWGSLGVGKLHNSQDYVCPLIWTLGSNTNCTLNTNLNRFRITIGFIHYTTAVIFSGKKASHYWSVYSNGMAAVQNGTDGIIAKTHGCGINSNISPIDLVQEFLSAFRPREIPAAKPPCRIFVFNLTVMRSGW